MEACLYCVRFWVEDYRIKATDKCANVESSGIFSVYRIVDFQRQVRHALGRVN